MPWYRTAVNTTVQQVLLPEDPGYDQSTAGAVISVDQTYGAGPLLRFAPGEDSTEVFDGVTTVPVGQSSEADEALSITPTKLVPVGLASETDSAQPVTPVRIYSIGFASETDDALSITPLKTTIVAVGQATETDTAFSITPMKIVAVGLASEADAAQPITPTKTAAIGQASEADAALPITPLKAVAMGQAAESDAAQPVAPAKQVGAGQAGETDAALSITPIKVVPIGIAEEVSAALPITLPGTQVIPIGRATEADEALPVVPIKLVPLGQASEIAEAQAIQALKLAAIGIAQETDTATPIPVVGGGLEPPPPDPPTLDLGDDAPDLAGFVNAMVRMRGELGGDVPFFTEFEYGYPPGTPLNPETGEPFDPTVPELGAGGASASVHVGVYMRPIQGGFTDLVKTTPLGLVDVDNALLDVSPADYEANDLAEASEVELFGERYEITDRDIRGLLDDPHRILLYVRKR